MFICLLLIFVISTISVLASFEFDETRTSSVFFAIIDFISVTAIIIAINTPKPIDVYRNKTTLEITYKDNIPIDSTVVFKDKEK